MPESTAEIKLDDSMCTVRLDRLQFVADTWSDRLSEIPGFCVRGDRFVRPQTSVQTYRRVRNHKNSKTETTLDIQYQPRPPWLPPVKVTVTGDDRMGLRRWELQGIFEVFKDPRLLTVELALDFSKTSGVDRAFVLRHGVFGKSHLVGGRLFKDLRFGTRYSDTMIRAYDKVEIPAYRVEIELRRHRITNLADLPNLDALLSPARVSFARIDWTLLADHLSRKKLPVEKILTQVQSYAFSMHRALAFLRSEVGLHNVHRFLRPLEINDVIKEALVAWARMWRSRIKEGCFS